MAIPEAAMSLTAAVVMRPGSFPDGSFKVDCEIPLRLTATKSLTLTGGATEMRRQDNGELIASDTLDATETAQFWSKAQISPGSATDVTRTFGSAVAFQLLLRFHFVDENGTPGVVEGVVPCPARDELSGKYALAFINGQRIPTDDGTYNIYYDTLVFLPHFNYYSKDSVSLVSNPSQQSATITEPRTYLIVSETEINLTKIYAGQPGGVLQVDRNSITQQRDGPDGFVILRFDRVP